MRTITVGIERKKASRTWHTWLTGKAKWETFTEKRTFEPTYRGLEDAVLVTCMFPVVDITASGDFSDIMGCDIGENWDKWQLCLAWHRVQTKAQIDRAIKALEYQQMEIAAGE